MELLFSDNKPMLKKLKQKIGTEHNDFVLNVFKYSKRFEISFYSHEYLKPAILIEINKKKIHIEYQDWASINSSFKYENEYCFKTQYSEGYVDGIKNLFPFSQSSFLDWDEYFRLSKTIKYKADSDIILNNQKPYGNAKERRYYIRDLLKSNFDEVDTKITSRLDFWNKINDCLVYVHAPGNRNNMLDRAQIQMMGFGCCTISPKIINILPYYKKLIPDVHYIRCKDDYSDLVKKVKWCKENRKECVEIGENAKKLFLETSTPDKIVNFILKKIETDD